MPADPDDPTAPPPSPEEVARFRAELVLLSGELTARFGDTRDGAYERAAIADYATTRLRDHGYALRCDARGAVPLPPDSRWWADGDAR